MKAMFLGLSLLVSVAAALAGPTGTVEKVQFKSSQVLVWPGGQALVAPDEAKLPFSIVVRTNGAFTVNGGKARTLNEGETLGADGLLLKPDGSVTPVMDHVAFRRGRVTVCRDGEVAEATEAVTLGDGTTVAPDGKITPQSGSPRRLLDGEVFQIAGAALPVRDTITLQNGRVQVQKDGAMLTVDMARSVMMNDGTKVFGNGTVEKASGERVTLTEGQVLVIEGVVTRAR